MFLRIPIREIEFIEKHWREIKIHFCAKKQAILYFLG